MKTPITQPTSNAGRLSWKLLPALLAAFFSLGIFNAGAQTVAQIGTGTGSMYSQYSTSPNSPIGFYYATSRTQYIYTASELIAAGFSAGGNVIHQIAFKVGSLYGGMDPAPGYRISMGHTTLSTLTSGTSPNGFQTVSTLVYSSPAGYPYALGWNTITLNTPFSWNGTDNIIIDICHTRGVSGTSPSGGAGVYYNTKTSSGLYYSNSSAASACGITSVSASSTSNRPDIKFVSLVPCSGKPTAGTLNYTGTVSTLCPGTSVTLVATGQTANLNLVYEWQTATSASGPWTAVTSGGLTNDRYTTPPLISNTYYRFKVLCTNGPDSNFSSVVGFTFSSGPTYGKLPYFESFESWVNGCATSDKVASGNWTNSPATGNSSWRRNDQGLSTAWTGNYTTGTIPKAPDGTYSARYNASYTTSGEGYLNLYLDCSAQTGAKELDFWWMLNYAYAYPMDSLNADLSTDGGVTFTNITGLGYANAIAAGGSSNVWMHVGPYTINSNSANTVIRFRAKAAYSGYYDIFLDAVRVIPPCAAKPTAGKIDTVRTCSGKPFKLKLTGTSQSAGLAYLWQYLPAGATVWQNLPGGTVANPTATITTATAFRAIVTCTNTTPTVDDTSAVFYATLAPFYYCYCDAPSSISYPTNSYNKVGNVKITNPSTGAILLDNGNPSPLSNNTNDNNTATYNSYSGVPGIPVPRLIRDTTYRFATVIVGSPYVTGSGAYSPAAIWIDFDRNGVFSPTAELIFMKPLNGTGSLASQTLSGNYTIPSNAQIGLTGMRIMSGYFSPAPTVMDPCGGMYYSGEVEDYLVYIEYPPCAGPVTAGTASASDTSICPGYSVDLYDTSYEHKRTGILRAWEFSVNGGASWAVVPNSFGRDTMFNVVVTAPTQYRLRVRCSITGDTTYSNVVYVNTPIPVRCYPVSQAAIGAADSSDIGAFILGGFVNPGPKTPAGPHLMNPQAHKRRTDYTTMTPIELNADSTYRLAIFQTMPGGVHADALISVFMDFNNDLDYDLNVPGPPFTSELVYQGRTSASNFFPDVKITIPNAVIPNMLTGMRVVINNDTNPMAAGNTGAGTFTSGEVEDYLIIFRKTGLGVNNTGLLQNLSLYPNPTEGKFTVLSDAARSVAHLDVVVTTITGQQVLSRSFENVGTRFTTNLDLSTQAKGIYFVEIRADGEKITRKLVVR